MAFSHPRYDARFSPRSRDSVLEVPRHRRIPRILVVDDNPDTMVLRSKLLETRGYPVVAVPNLCSSGDR